MLISYEAFGITEQQLFEGRYPEVTKSKGPRSPPKPRGQEFAPNNIDNSS
jgi:hypothetical protein